MTLEEIESAIEQCKKAQEKLYSEERKTHSSLAAIDIALADLMRQKHKLEKGGENDTSND